MGNMVKGHDRVVSMHLLSVFGSVASIAGLMLAVIFRIKDKKSQKTKESNRQSAKG